jgi:mono/diheme cytochrome c family protein
MMVVRCLVSAVILMTGIAVLAPGLAAAAPPSFTRDIKPLLSNRCAQCHGPDAESRQGGDDEGLRLDTLEGATADLGGRVAIQPGTPDESELVARITSTDPDIVMPPPDSGAPLTPAEIDRLTRWVAAGAEYEPHWAYVAPKRPAVPDVATTGWPKNDIDRFVLARLEAEGLSPQPEADRITLARRLSLDLVGLPPTPEEVDAFVADSSPGAVETFVDRLLAHNGYGEHMARQWLDLARYADSAGYADDRPRTIWAWRDWVIQACDSNMPFDEFTVRQIAGDLLPGATNDDKVATAFHRNTLTNSEGGTIDEEFRIGAVVDRVNTTMSTWMGTTIACCQCHDHKYDPLSQKEFFGLYAILNQTADADRPNEAPVLSLYTPEQEARREALSAELAEIAKHVPSPTPGVTEPPEFRPLRELTASLEKDRDAIKPRTTVPVMEELADAKRRITKLQYRGNWNDLGPEVAPGVPAVFHAPPPSPDGRVDRLALAQWLIDPANPLTARVVVNRLWERLFGIGLVSTSEEFGAQGDLPSHPELLDWLACELVDRGWDTKAITRLIVTSATYRQSSTCPPNVVADDPENRLFACGPRVRLSAEVIRDQALAAAGLLSRKKGGPSVNPPQPDLGLKAAFGGGLDWKTSQGEDRYRRAIYTTWRRSNPYPSMATFDAPNREVCTLRRPRTNTPLQALVTLNDPVYVEAAQALARRMIAEGGSTSVDRASRGFRLVLARKPTGPEIDRLVQLFDDAQAEYRGHEVAARKLATEPLGDPPPGLAADMPELAAWTVVANVILNLDETFMCP